MLYLGFNKLQSPPSRYTCSQNPLLIAVRSPRVTVSKSGLIMRQTLREVGLLIRKRRYTKPRYTVTWSLGADARASVPRGSEARS